MQGTLGGGGGVQKPGTQVWDWGWEQQALWSLNLQGGDRADWGVGRQRTSHSGLTSQQPQKAGRTAELHLTRRQLEQQCPLTVISVPQPCPCASPLPSPHFTAEKARAQQR